ncbi:TRAP transporter small permease subunit [Rhodobacterales bacterium HKCCE2091]|nr:TRAP transporter small permease subunit [Rhodobacterales bacterium HKCCE2091]
MAFLEKAASLTARLLALLGATAVVLMMLHICLDVVMRNMFDISFSVTNAMVARYYMVPLAFLPLGWIELRGEMVSVEVVDWLLPDAAIRISDVAVCLVGAAIYAGLTYATWGAAVSNWNRGTMLELGTTPFHVYPSYIFPVVGFALAALACLARAITRAAGRTTEHAA